LEPRGDRLRVITAGLVGNMDARLRTSGLDIVAATETEDALIDAVSGDEPDAIVVEADLCASLEHVRDLAPDAVVIVVGDHTPAGALGRVERGMSGTAMAGLLHALVAEGVGAVSCGGSRPRSGQGPGSSAWAYRSCPVKQISSEPTSRTRFATPHNSSPRRAPSRSPSPRASW
jgi:hypothetical protein